jgi:hypothetical protein
MTDSATNSIVLGTWFIKTTKALILSIDRTKLFIGKFTSLGASTMSLQQTMYFDSLVNGKKQTLKKIRNAYYEGF